MHIADFAEYGMTVMATQVYTKAELERAHRVQDLVHNCCYPSYQELTYMLQDGNLMWAYTSIPRVLAALVEGALQGLLESGPTDT
jgi:hypothetical protein